MRCAFLAPALFVLGCSSAASPDAATTSAADSDPDVGVCVGAFGDQLTSGFGRIDGTLVAIVRPVIDAACPMPNRDHVILEVSMDGTVYRMVVNVESDRPDGDRRVQMATVDAPLPAPAWSEGWHLGVALDYASTLGQHGDQGFTPLEMTPLVTSIVSALRVGQPISVYGVSGQGRPDSAHDIHRNRAGDSADGAIVVGPDTATPGFLLFRFANQTF
jgi:hypothetical protein